MDPTTLQRRGVRTLLLTGVGLNLLGAGSLALTLYTLAGRCNGRISFLGYCGAPASAYLGFASAVTICGVLPLVGLAYPQVAPAAVVSQGILTFLSVWAVVNWGFFGLGFSAIGGMIGLVGSGILYRRGRPGPPVTTLLFGASWAGMVAFWMAYLFSNPILLPMYYTPGPFGGATGCLAALAYCGPAIQLAVLAIGLSVEMALVPLWVPPYWPFGLVGAMGVLASTILAPSYFDSLWFPAIVAALALGIGAAGYREFVKTGRSIGQALDGLPPRTGFAPEGKSPMAGHDPRA
ncbi:MAG: hypothetical protein WAN40_09685 [Thermoplasmata archaeon]